MQIEQAWQHRGLLAIALWPLSMVFRFVSFVRVLCYRYGIKSSSVSPGLPVIVVGNITVGGTGKSPLVIHLVHECMKHGKRPGIVSRGYGGQVHKQPHLLQSGDLAQKVGDEPAMLYELTGVPVCICTARADAVQFLAENTDVDIILSDDGLQHLAMGRQAEIIVIDAERRFGNQWFLPAGPLRESLSRLKTVDLLVEQWTVGKELPTDRAAFQLEPFKCVPLLGGEARDMQAFQGKTVHAIAGIGHPQRFFNSLKSVGIKVIEHPKSDHHVFGDEDFQFDEQVPVLLTRKDAVKIKQIPSLRSISNEVYVVDVCLQPNAMLLSSINEILDEINVSLNSS